MVDRDGLLITNYHVIADSIWKSTKNKIFIEVDNKSLPAEILKVDFVNDLALIKVPYKFSSQIQIAKHAPDHGDEIYSMGLPEDINWTVIEGIYNGVANLGPYELIHMSSGLNSGMSGGPTVNGSNELVAVNVSTQRESQQISFGVPVKFVSLMLKDYKSVSPTIDELLVQLTDQVLSLQESMTLDLLSGFEKSKTLENVRLPQFPKNIRCWGSGSEDKKASKFSYITESCDVDKNVSLGDSQYTGSFDISFHIVKREKLSWLSWIKQKSSHWYMPGIVSYFDSDSKINFSKPECYREVVRVGEEDRTIALCVQKLLPYSGIYDGYINLHVPVGDESFINSQVTLAGFSHSNIKKITKALLTYSYNGGGL